MTHGLMLNGLWLPDVSDPRPSRFPVPRPNRFVYSGPKEKPHPSFTEAVRLATKIPFGKDDRFEVWEKMLAEYFEGDKTTSIPLLNVVRSSPNFFLPMRHLDYRTHSQLSNWLAINVGVREFIRETIHNSGGIRDGDRFISQIEALDNHLLIVSRSLVDLSNCEMDDGIVAWTLLRRARQSLGTDTGQDDQIGPIIKDLQYGVAAF